MKRFLLTLTFLLLLGISQSFNNDPMCGQKSSAHPDNIVIRDGNIQGAQQGIVGGGEAKPHSWPWQVAISINGKGSCGGTIISKQWIMTAAHCINGAQPSMIGVGFGMHQTDYLSILMHNTKDPGAKICFGTKTAVHKEYIKLNGTKIDYDIAVVKVDCTLEWSDTIRPACLPSSSDSFYTPGEKVVLTGWGKTANGGTTDKLKQLVTDVVGQNDPEWYTGGQVAVAGDEFGTCSSKNGASQGDSGGPMHAMRNGKWYVAGVTSNGDAGSDLKYCDSVDATSNFTHVPSFIDWIDKNMD